MTMNPRVAIIGSNGQLGSDLVSVFETAGWDVLPFTHADFDIRDARAVGDAIRRIRGGVIVNTAALHDVDRCERDPLEAFEVNAIGARTLARAVRSAGGYFIHVSTDYVFSGEKSSPYVEDDLPGPLNVYGNTKLAGEYFILAEGVSCAVVRTSGLFGHHICRAKGYNFVELMLRLARERGKVRVVDTETLTPTFTKDLARQIVRLADGRIDVGICHATAGGQCSWYEFAAAIFEIAGVDVKLEIAGPDEFPAKVRRPRFSVLENRRLKDLGLDIMRNWRVALEDYLSERESDVQKRDH